MLTSKRIFFGIITVSLVVCALFWVSVYSPQQNEYVALQQELEETIKRYDKASRAHQDLDNIKQRLDAEKQGYEELRKRFIYKSELNSITQKIQELSRSNNLELIDFTPVFNAFFQDTSSSEVKALPFSVTVKGRFLDIGRFIESWSDQDVYMIAEEAYVGKSVRSRSTVEADISGKLYAWARGESNANR